MRHIAALTMALGLFAAAPSAADPRSPPAPAPVSAIDPRSLPADRLVLITEDGARTFTIEIADDPVELARGLMFREDLPRDHGMLFDFGAEGERRFWMKNTPLPLDLIFARGDGTVISIKKGEPFSLEGIPSDGPARFVLEVNAGVAGQIGLVPGDRLVHRRVKR